MKNKFSPTLTISQTVTNLSKVFSTISDSARLDAELLISYVLHRSRSWLLAHGDYTLTEKEWQVLTQYSQRRAQGEPIAYILGCKEFWGLELIVSPDVLIPRPETEHLVEWILENFDNTLELNVLDLGTGSGAIAIALAKERNKWKVNATDASFNALSIAKQNAANHQLTNIHFYYGHWFEPLVGKKFDLIVSNPPYIADKDSHLKLLTYEPISALAAGPHGTEALQEIITKATDFMNHFGYLVLEHGYDQSHQLTNFLTQSGFTKIQIHQDYSGHNRFVTAQLFKPGFISDCPQPIL